MALASPRTQVNSKYHETSFLVFFLHISCRLAMHLAERIWPLAEWILMTAADCCCWNPLSHRHCQFTAMPMADWMDLALWFSHCQLTAMCLADWTDCLKGPRLQCLWLTGRIGWMDSCHAGCARRLQCLGALDFDCNVFGWLDWLAEWTSTAMSFQHWAPK